MKQYQVKLINRNGYTIVRASDTIEGAKQAVSFAPLAAFFGWIYDVVNGQMVAQNLYNDHWKRCNNDSFVPYY